LCWTTVATFAWNTQEHVEAYYAVTCSGAVLHTANLRLHPEQVAWTMNHAGDRVVASGSYGLPDNRKITEAKAEQSENDKND